MQALMNCAIRFGGPRDCILYRSSPQNLPNPNLIWSGQTIYVKPSPIYPLLNTTYYEEIIYKDCTAPTLSSSGFYSPTAD